MKVLYINPIFLDYRVSFYRELKKKIGGEFNVLYSPKRYYGRYDKLLNSINTELSDIAIPFWNEWIYYFNNRSFKFTDKGRKMPFTLGLFFKLIKISPEIVIAESFLQWTPIVVLYCLIFRKPLYVAFERTMHTERNTPKWITIHRKLTDKFVKGYFANGKETREYLISIGIKERKIHIGGMSADSEGLRTGVLSMTKDEISSFKKLYNDGSGLIYFFSGQIIKRKGIDHLIEAWKKHILYYPNDTLLVLGMGEWFERLKNETENINSIKWIGRVDYSEVCKYYAIADVFVMPTIEDNWSLVVPEAMSCGLPVATSIYNGCHSELIEEGVNGSVFDAFDHDSIVKSLSVFHEADLNMMGAASILKEKPFNIENSTNRMAKVLLNSKL